MHDLLTGLLQCNFAAGAAIILVLILRKACRTVFGARTAYALWLLVPFAAAASLAPPRSADLVPAPPLAPIFAAAEQAVAQAWTWGAGAPVQASGFQVDPVAICATLWLAGATLMIVWLTVKQAIFERLLAQRLAGPAVVGVLSPRIVTPADFEHRFNAREQALVLAHEKVHLARHDSRINGLVALTRCVCWFNPLVHIAAHMMRIDQEIACDAAVVARHPRARAPYAKALLKTHLVAVPLPLGCYWPAHSEHPLTERIAMLDRPAPSLVRRIAGGVLVAVLATGAGYTAWGAAPAGGPAAEAPLAHAEEALAPAAATPESAPTFDRERAPEIQTGPLIDPSDVDAQGRPRYARPFDERYDADEPISIEGVLVRADWLQPNAAFWVYGRGTRKDGADRGEQLWRVDGGAPALLSPEMRRAGSQAVGREIAVRGYGTRDKSCSPTCRLVGRNVSFPNGGGLSRLNGGEPDCTLEQVRNYSCPGSEKVSPIPTPPTRQEIAKALIKSGKDVGSTLSSMR